MPDPKPLAALSPSPSSLPVSITAQQVIEMYAELRLLVTDDGARIKKEVDARRDYYLSQRNVPDSAVRARTDLALKHADMLLNRRAELLRIVQAQYLKLAKIALEGALRGGVNTLTDSLLRELRGLAQDTCRVDDPLADQWLADFMAREGLKKGEGLIPNAVDQFAAESRHGEIALNWSINPALQRHEIEIEREQQSTAGGAVSKAKTIYRGRGTSVVDADVAAGSWYRYTAFSVDQGQRSGAGRLAQALCIGEVEQPRKTWTNAGLKLDWTYPGSPVGLAILRRRDAAPAVRMEAQGPVAADASTALVYQGNDTTWTDRDQPEGATLHYKLVVDFGHGLYSRGVNLDHRVPAAPPSVPTARATYGGSAQRQAVTIDWDGVTHPSRVEYVVVRRAGRAAAARPEDGRIVATTAQTRCFDEDVVSGDRYVYTIFTRASDQVGLLSRYGTPTPPVDICADVTNLQAMTANGTVNLSWVTPPHATSVQVRRSLSPTHRHGEGTLVTSIGMGHAKDAGLKNGQRYHYLVICGYRPEGGEEVFSAGVQIAAVPDELPEPVHNLEIQALGASIRCSWTSPRLGHVVIIRSTPRAAIELGKLLKPAELDGLGDRIVVAAAGSAIDARPDVRRPFYQAFTVLGSHAVAGASASAVLVPDVTGLRVTTSPRGASLQWEWPAGCTAARVVRRTDVWPERADDPKATAFQCTRSDYMGAGDRFFDPLAGVSAWIHYVVYAQASDAPGAFLASGMSQGCRQSFYWIPQMSLRYWLSASPDGEELLFHWRIEHPMSDFGGAVLVANHANVPTSAADGEVLLKLESTATPAGQRVVGVDSLAQRHRRWFFCKLFVLNAAQRQRILLTHPDTSRAISSEQPIAIEDEHDPPRLDMLAVPKTVVCPECFDVFPNSQMLFSDKSGGQAVPGVLSVLDRILGRPPQPPTDARGQVLTRKVCPKLHELPYTAGVQPSVVLGLIGAKFSGKSHYVASLITRLMGQAGKDMAAALMPVGDTQSRFVQEFYETLFGNGLELPMTIGEQRPLIYDLKIDGRLWDEEQERAVTLSLYDTAGENLNSPESVEQTLKYLRVASGILFVVDPLQMQAVRDALSGLVPLPDRNPNAEPSAILSRILDKIDSRVVMGGGRLHTPIAVVFTKCDVLRDHGLFEPNRLWNTNSRHVGYFDRALHDDLSGMMAELVQRWNPNAYTNIRQRFSRSAFFGVSATGCAPDPVTRRYKFIAPQRVEDPLFWLLAELGAIPSRGHDDDGH